MNQSIYRGMSDESSQTWWDQSPERLTFQNVMDLVYQYAVEGSCQGQHLPDVKESPGSKGWVGWLNVLYVFITVQ